MKKDEAKISSASNAMANADNQVEAMEKNSFLIPVFIAIGIVVLIAISIHLVKKKKNHGDIDIVRDDDGGAEQ